MQKGINCTLYLRGKGKLPTLETHCTHPTTALQVKSMVFATSMFQQVALTESNLKVLEMNLTPNSVCMYLLRLVVLELTYFIEASKNVFQTLSLNQSNPFFHERQSVNKDVLFNQFLMPPYGLLCNHFTYFISL